MVDSQKHKQIVSESEQVFETQAEFNPETQRVEISGEKVANEFRKKLSNDSELSEVSSA